MANARLYVKGEPWEIMGTVKDKFLASVNETQTTRSGRNYPKTSVSTKKLTVDDVMATRSEFLAVVEFLENCDNRRFPVTVAFSEDCPEGDEPAEFIYLNCMLEGEPEYDLFEYKITGLEFSYEDRRIVS